MSALSRARQAHTRAQAAERFGLELTADHQNQIVQKIRNSRRKTTLTVVPLRRMTETTALIAVLWKDLWLPVVYQHRKGQIRTVLPEIELVRHKFRIPRPATPEEMQAAAVNGQPVREVVFGEPYRLRNPVDGAEPNETLNAETAAETTDTEGSQP